MKSKLKFKITYNAPVTLTFVIICALLFLVDQKLLGGKFIPSFLTAPAKSGVEGGFNPSSFAHYLRLFFHVTGHIDLNHLLGNLSFVLLLGPLLEERYGSKMLCLMMLVTALVTGVINSCLIPLPLCGASGIVFMLIVLASITTIEKNVIPLTFVFVVVLFFGREFLGGAKTESVSTVAHVAGGLCGSLFGFLVAPKEKRTTRKSKPKEDNSKTDSEDDDYELRKKKRLEAIDSQSPRFRGYRTSSSAEDESEVIGTIEL